jgi:hypothetical protein
MAFAPKALTDSHCREIGDYDALVIVQLAGFEEGELLLYERLQMGPMLLARYAKDGSEKARRQMLAMCQTDPEILADVLGHYVNMVSDRLEEVSWLQGACVFVCVRRDLFRCLMDVAGKWRGRCKWCVWRWS